MREVRGRRGFWQALLRLAALFPVSTGAFAAQDPAGDSAGWSGRAELNLASSFGNAGSGSIGLSAETTRATESFRLALDGGLLRASTDTVKREAVGLPDAFEVVRRVESRVSADRTHLRARVTEATPRADGPPLGFFAAAGWERDAPAGVRARYDFTVGATTAWRGAEAARVRLLELSAGFSAVHQRDEVPDPEVAAGSLGLRFDGRSEGQFRAAELALVASSTWNLRNRDDLRFDAKGSVAVPLSTRLAFRTSLQTLFDSRPSLERVALLSVPGGSPVGRVAVRRGRTDWILITALALRW